ncbi:unnamed protein product [Colias eurytheme]|nr:unnamed protein product [Colias eurytheme]
MVFEFIAKNCVNRGILIPLTLAPILAFIQAHAQTAVTADTVQYTPQHNIGSEQNTQRQQESRENTEQ